MLCHSLELLCRESGVLRCNLGPPNFAHIVHSKMLEKAQVTYFESSILNKQTFKMSHILELMFM